jgi:signal peptidase II
MNIVRKYRNWYTLFAVAALTLAADWASKTVVVNNMELYETWHPPVALVRSVVSLTYTTNTGAAFGLFPDHGALFVGIAFVVIAAILVYYRQLPAGYFLVRLALGLQLGGALGNLVDRLRQGYVVDFFDFNFWPMQDWALFNVADSAIVVGTCLLALVMLREDLETQEQQATSSESEAASEPGAS